MIGRYQLSNTCGNQTDTLQDLVLVKEFLSLVMSNLFSHFGDKREQSNRSIVFVVVLSTLL